MAIGRWPGVTTGVAGASVGVFVAVIEVAAVVGIKPVSMLWLMMVMLRMDIMLRWIRRGILRRERRNLQLMNQLL